MLLPFKERGFGGAIQVVAARFGKVVGGGLVLLVYQRWGWHTAISLMILMSALMALQLYVYREPVANAVASTEYGWRQLCGRIVSYWRLPGIGLPWLYLLLFAGVPYGLVATTFIPQLHELGWQAAEIGTVLAIYTPIACVAVAPLAGWLVRSYTRYRLVLTVSLFQCLILAAFIFLVPLSAYYAHVIVLLILALSMGYTVLMPVLIALFRDKASTRLATLDSTLQLSVILGGAYLAGFGSLRIANYLGYEIVYIASTTIGLLVCALIFWQGPKLFLPSNL